MAKGLIQLFPAQDCTHTMLLLQGKGLGVSFSQYILPQIKTSQHHDTHLKIHPVLYQYNIPIQTKLYFYLECGHPTLGIYTALLHKEPGKMNHHINISSNVVQRNRDSP